MPLDQPLELLITDAVVLTLDAQRRLLPGGHVGIRDGRIAVVEPGTPSSGVAAERILDANGGVLHPGLIDGHAHVGWGLVRAAVPESFAGDEILHRFDHPMLATTTDEDEHIGTLLACVEMAMNGTTCFADTGSALHDLAPTVEAVEVVGIRGMVSYLIADAATGIPALDQPTDRCLERIEDGLGRHPRGNGRAWACAGLVGMETASDTLVVGAKALADGAGVPLNLHKSFAADEVAACRARLGGADPLRGFDQLDVLDPNVTLVHLNYCTDPEVDLLASARSAVVHCPAASMMYAIGGSRHGRFPALLRAGVPVALGTDSTHWGNAWDLARSVYLAATLHKEASGERPAVAAEQALEMATLHGAAAVGRTDELGSIEVGKLADLVLHGVDRPETHPPLDPVAGLVFSGQSRTVRHVFVGGEQVVADGRPARVDLEALLPAADRAARDLLQRLDYERPSRWPVFRTGVDKGYAEQK